MTIDVYCSAPWYLEHLKPIITELGTAVGETFAGRAGIMRARPRDPTRPMLVASYGDLCRARRIGYRSFILAQHGAGQSYAGDARNADRSSYPGGRDHGDVALFLVPNEHAASRWRKAYPRARVEVVGCPKLDTLPQRVPGPGPAIAVSFHWDWSSLCPETRSAAPAYMAALPALARRYKVIGHAHPRLLGKLLPMYKRLGIEVVADFSEVCRRADVYCVDNSSTLFEFAATGRPVGVLNLPSYRRNINHGLRFWQASRVGVNVDAPGDLLAGVERALECRPEDVAAREAALDLVYQPRTGSAALAAAAIREIPAVRPIDRRNRARLGSR